MSNPRVAIDIVANDKSGKGILAAEKRLGGITKAAGRAAGSSMSAMDRTTGKAGGGLIRTFAKIEQASARAFGGNSVSAGMLNRLNALRSASGALGEGMGEAATAGTAMEGAVASIGVAAVGTVGVVTALAAASVKLADGWGKNARSLGNMSSLLGISTKGLQQFAGAAERAGVDKDTATGALGSLQTTLDDARYARNPGATAALSRLGVKMKLRKDGTVDSEAMLPAIADSLARQNSSGRRRAAQMLGIPLAALPAFTQGGKALASDMGDVGRRGAVMGDGDVKLGGQIARRDTIGMQQIERGILAGQRANAGVVKSVGDAAIGAYRSGAIGRAATAAGSGIGRASRLIADGGLIGRADAQTLVPAGSSDGRGAEMDSGNAVRRRQRGGRTLYLSRGGIRALEKTVQTEWAPSVGDAQAHGVIDTILNRTASGHFGRSVEAVVNQRKQFSNINGPVAWREGRHSVSEFPDRKVTDRTRRVVADWLEQRAEGVPSSVGDNLNYANPVQGTDPRNLPWVNALRGPVLGRGRSIHRHGTTPGNQRYRPGEFGVDYAGRQQAAAPPEPIPVHVTVVVHDDRRQTHATVKAGKSNAPVISRSFVGQRER